MTGRTDGFTQKILDAVGAQDIVVSRCVIHEEYLSTNVLALAEIMKFFVKCVNYIDDYQMELIELQADMDNMMGYSENCLVSY